MVSVVCDGTKMVILGGQIIQNLPLKLHNLSIPDLIYVNKGSLDAEIKILKPIRNFEKNGRDTVLPYLDHLGPKWKINCNSGQLIRFSPARTSWRQNDEKIVNIFK